MSDSLILQQVTIALGNKTLIEPLTAKVAPGEVLTVMGPSGSGKSSLLGYIAGLLEAPFVANGTVLVGSTRIDGMPCHLRRVGLQFQDDLLFPHMSIGENIVFAQAHANPGSPSTKQERRAQAQNDLSNAGLAGFFERDPASLSGGQRARVALLRTLAANPRVLLLDEPFNRLDAHLRADMRRFVFELTKARGIPSVLVTHDSADASAAGGQILQLSLR